MVHEKNVYVVFEDNTSLWWLRFLKRGFRHCKMYIKITQTAYLEINPMSNQMFIFLHIFEKRSEFLRVIHKSDYIRIKIRGAKLKCAPLGAFTCVEVVKRVLGIHNFFVFTPYQLYKFLSGCRKKVLTF